MKTQEIESLAKKNSLAPIIIEVNGGVAEIIDNPLNIPIIIKDMDEEEAELNERMESFCMEFEDEEV